MSSVQLVTIRNVVFSIVCSFVMLVVDAIGDAYLSIGCVPTLYVVPFGRKEDFK